MISVVGFLREDYLAQMLHRYLDQHREFHLAELTDQPEVAVQAVLGISPDLVVCQGGEHSLELLGATARYVPDSWFLVLEAPTDQGELLALLHAGLRDALAAPCTEDALWQAMDRARRYAESRFRESAGEQEQIRRLMDKRFFEDTIVTDSATAILGNFSAMEQEYQIAFQPGWFQPLFLVLDPRPQEALHADAFLPVLQVEALVREFFTPHGVELVCYVKDHTLSVILNTPQPLPDCRGLCRSFLSLCSRRFPWYCGPNTITVGLGNPTQDSRQLPLAIQSAKFAGWMRFGLGKGRIIPYPDSYGGYVKKEDFLPEENRRTLQRSVELMDFPLCRQTILESLEATKNSGEFISVALTLGDVLVEALNHYGKETVVHSSKYLQLAENMPPMVESMDSTTRMQDAILSWAEHGIAQLQGMEAQGEDGSILRAKQYIALNYQNPLRLDDVAQHVGLSAPYFSIKFRKCTGSTFVEYLTGLRMERAKELLLSTNRKVLDIATAVGFQDARHFSRIFKKYMGVLPTEFRRKH